MFSDICWIRPSTPVWNSPFHFQATGVLVIIRKACAVVNVVERDNKVGFITNAIDRLANDLALLREKQSAATSFKSRARWFDQHRNIEINITTNRHFAFVYLL